MSDSLTERLRQSFIEDARENFTVAEEQLLTMSRGVSDPASIGALFRAIHSVKGGAGSFGFGTVTETAHGMESCLDAVRKGTLSMSVELAAVLLAGVDLLKRMVENPALEVALERTQLATALERLINGAPSAGWRLDFTPPPGLLAVGPDPLKLFASLAELGPISVSADVSKLPPLDQLNPFDCSISWVVTLPGSVSRAAVEGVFDWVASGWSLTELAAPAPTVAPVLQSPGKPSAAPLELGTSASIRVPVDKLDQLMNMVGELVITQSMLGEFDTTSELTAGRVAQISEGLAQLARNTKSLQESVMRLRSQPLSVVFARLPRVVHDLSEQLGKEVDLVVSGDATELDKTVLEKLGDPLVHLVRNCVDHGLEKPDVRRANGKPARGRLSINSYGRGKDIYVEVEDDGRGLDCEAILAKAKERGLVATDARLSSEQICELIFEAGLSTAAQVTDISGRGVGMDVVRQNVRALGGEIMIRTERGRGTTFTLRLPLSLAIMEGQLVRVGRRNYVIPLLSIVESIQPDWANLHPCGHDEGYSMRGELIPIVDLPTRLGQPQGDRTGCLMVVVETERGRVGLLVDELLSQQQVVIKSLEANYGSVVGLAGATILGDGSVSLILEPNGLHKTAALAA